jgi:hypothetical protein
MIRKDMDNFIEEIDNILDVQRCLLFRRYGEISFFRFLSKFLTIGRKTTAGIFCSTGVKFFTHPCHVYRISINEENVTIEVMSAATDNELVVVIFSEDALSENFFKQFHRKDPEVLIQELKEKWVHSSTSSFKHPHKGLFPCMHFNKKENQI